MIYEQIKVSKNRWLNSPGCPVNSIIKYIRDKASLREAQIEAIETYLFLKLKCENKPLRNLFFQELFNCREDLSDLHISQKVRNIFEKDNSARAFYEFSKIKNGDSKPVFPDLEKFIIANADEINFPETIRKLFYSIDYPDYLFSLPMGAGKTFLMAVFIYLDLYFAINEPENKVFAHNFIILIPSGLKSSIVPSLKTIQNFDPSWILPEPSASNIRKILKFEILDKPKSAKKSNKARNPNSQKIAHFQPFDTLRGLVMIVNAEKVILDRLDLDKSGELIEKSDDEKDHFANELRNLIGKIPNLAIHIDEVHHAAKDEIKLRQVVNMWNAGGTITGVCGYSGTPYLSPAEKVAIADKVILKLPQITNTVYYYPLATAIQNFLKKPKVEVAHGFEPIGIIKKGVEDFYSKYGLKTYFNGCSAKLAIYCGSIERLEEEIYPFLIGEMNINPEHILKFHRGNKKHKLPKENELEFLSLDIPETNAGKNRKLILLVQIGKEGWDCRSLTGVILSQKGDSPSNMVLQTSCRCLRQVDKGQDESAVIWLNEFNAEKLNKQLKDEQHTSIEEINKLSKNKCLDTVQQISRLEYLKLPEVKFYQLKVRYNETIIDASPDTENKLDSILGQEDRLSKGSFVEHRNLEHIKETRTLIYELVGKKADFNQWVLQVSKESLGSVALRDLSLYKDKLLKIFKNITCPKDGCIFFNEAIKQDEVRKLIRLAFRSRRELKTESEIIPNSAKMLLVKNLKPILKSESLFPDEGACTQILELDKTGESPDKALQKLLEDFEQLKRANPLIASMVPTPKLSLPVYDKDRSFHYLPYNFPQSAFELNFLKEALKIDDLIGRNLELYYNGDRFLSNFQIDCYARNRTCWKWVGKYTPDFLLIKRKDGEIHKILIIETKGSGYAEEKRFLLRRNFVESEFISMNNEKFGYNKFDYLYLSDDKSMDDNIMILSKTIKKFF